MEVTWSANQPSSRRATNVDTLSILCDILQDLVFWILRQTDTGLDTGSRMWNNDTTLVLCNPLYIMTLDFRDVRNELWLDIERVGMRARRAAYYTNAREPSWTSTGTD